MLESCVLYESDFRSSFTWRIIIARKSSESRVSKCSSPDTGSTTSQAVCYAVDLIQDTRHLDKPLKTVGIKVKSRVFSGGKQALKSANTRNRGRVCLF